MKIVYIQAVLTDNDEVVHNGEILGYRSQTIENEYFDFTLVFLKKN